MKKRKQVIFLLSFFACSFFNATAQKTETYDAFYQKTDVTAYAGMKFRFHGAVKADVTQSASGAALWARVDKKGGKVGFFDNMENRKIRSNKWKVYQIEGKIDDSAKNISVGGIFNQNGIFSFDDLVLEIQNKTGSWDKINIVNNGFETDSIAPWKFFYKASQFFVKSIAGDDAYEGKKYFKVIGSGMKAEYGSNDSAGHFVQANGIKIYYEEYGSGAPLLLLHGNSQSISAFKEQIPALATKYRVIAVDTRGHSQTEDKGDKFTYDLFAADMNALLNKLNVDSANIVGWSDGGNTGLIMAMKYPKKVKKLVTMGAVIFCDSTVVSQDLLNELKFGIEELKNAKTKQEKNDLKKALLLRDEPNYKFPDLKAIKCPVLVMAGEKDLVKIGHTKQIAANIPKGELYIAPSYSHYFPQENPAEFNRVVMEFLAK